MAGISRTEWQTRMDEDFPNGLVVHYGNPTITVPVIALHVVGEKNGNPVVTFSDFGEAKSWEDELTSYEVTQEKPKLVRATGASLGALQFSGNIGGGLEKLANERRPAQRAYVEKGIIAGVYG